jgi:hypothetical protein
MRATRILACLAALGALGFYFGPQRNLEQDEARLAKVAGTIAGRDVEIECPGTVATLAETSEQDGFVVFSPEGTPAKEARLSAGTCETLRRFLHGGIDGLGCLAHHGSCPVEIREAAIAVNVLSHEAWHLAGIRDEAATQCYALQSNADTAQRLGANEDDARALAGFILREVQPVLPPDYRDRACYDGGPLDLHADGESWP